jgi:hypothetical protein
VVRTVNTHMVVAYWLIGREIVQEEQGGKRRAGYGDALLEDLSRRLTEQYGKGYSVTNLQNFRTFYQVYAHRVPEIRHEARDELAHENGIGHKARDQSPSRTDTPISATEGNFHEARGESPARKAIRYEPRSELPVIQGFSPDLSWTHYRLLMRVENVHARSFYEIEAIRGRWSTPDLERQINSLLFERLLRSRNKKGVMALARKGNQPRQPIDILKDPFVLEFLDLPEGHELVESRMEQALVGLILCTDRNEAMVRYTLPKGQKQVFAARYRLALPSEEDLLRLLRRDWDVVVREQSAVYGEEKP